MDHRSLYKASRLADTSRKINKRAVEAKQQRSEKRKDLYLTSRNIEVSKNESRSEKQPNDVKTRGGDEYLRKRDEYVRKRDEYLRKFMAWKQEKQKRIEEEKKNKVKPFLSAVSKSLFAPSNHKFVPPKDLKMPTKGMAVRSQANNNKKIFKLDTPAVVKRTPLTLINNKDPKTRNITDSKKKSGDSAIKPVVKKPSSSTKKPKPVQKPPIVSIAKVSAEVGHPLVTPAVISQETQFPAFVTSTMRKSNTKNPDPLSQEPEISPIYPWVPTPAKEEVKMEPEGEHATRSKIRETRRSKRKSAAVDASHKSKDQSPVKSKGGTFENDCIETVKSENLKNGKRLEDIVDLNTTPVCDVNKEELSNYMSPFVTISRGKVSAKIEHEKRNSVYKLESSFCSPEESVEVRRIRETVKYFRKLLNDEIERMHSLCDTWEKYIADDGTGVIENGIDMVHAAIGQTRLLTSKKLQQFRGLIDKCEEGIAPTSDTLEVNQKIEVDDLEGFWSMVHLEIENIDKRFNNLERWKNNNWCDPDEAIEQPKRKTIKVSKFKKKKTQTEPNSLLRNTMLKEAQAAYKKSRRENTAADENVIMLPARKTRASTSKRRSSLLTPNTKMFKRKSQGSTPRISLNGKAKRSVERLQVSARKSILKTPGTARKSQRNVLFSEKLQFKSPDTPDEMLQVEPAFDDSLGFQRSLNLRTRRVLLASDEAR